MTYAFFARKPGLIPAYQALESAIAENFPDTTVCIQKSQLSFYASCGYASVSMPPWRAAPGEFFILTVYLPYPASSPRIFARSEPAPNRYTHHIPITKTEDVDAEIIQWLTDAHGFSCARKGRPHLGEIPITQIHQEE